MATTIPTHIHTGPEAQVPRPDLTGSSGANSGPPDEGSLLGRYYPSERSRKTHTQYSGTFAVCCTILSFGVRCAARGRVASILSRILEVESVISNIPKTNGQSYAINNSYSKLRLDDILGFDIPKGFSSAIAFLARFGISSRRVAALLVPRQGKAHEPYM
ncbi:predicted protein [Histoplasma capsulatum H143]|uniref:Uncharacterized protein n=1 Tax=Ajellomyces capsulatus (strain H143) TaxID=544712 RepID=C6HIT1_AJECH|nr:predicted protein [Histoplasma capsulatum H143]